MSEAMVRAIQEELNNAYGGVVTGPVDRVAAQRILQLFSERGWIGGHDLALVVQAAGGEIRITQDQITRDVPVLLQFQDQLNGDIVLKTVKTENNDGLKNPEPAQRESAESRTVQSGPIRVSPVSSGSE